MSDRDDKKLEDFNGREDKWTEWRAAFENHVGSRDVEWYLILAGRSTRPDRTSSTAVTDGTAQPKGPGEVEAPMTHHNRRHGMPRTNDSSSS